MANFTNIFLILMILPSVIFSKNDNVNRNHEYDKTFDCGDAKESNIKTAEDCFKQKPGRKWKCCFFEYNNAENNKKKGCLKVRKNDEDDLIDLQDYVSKLSPFSVFNCKSNYLLYSAMFTISLLFLLF